MGSGPVLAAASVEAGIISRDGFAAPGLAEFEPDRTGALPIQDIRETIGAAEGAVDFGGGLWSAARLEAVGDSGRLQRLELGWDAGPVSFAGGRGSVGFGYARNGSLVIGDTERLSRLQVRTDEAIRLPGSLRGIGSFAFSSFAGRLDGVRHQEEPYVWGGSISYSPHSRIQVGINRAALFGGDQEVTASRVVDMLIGHLTGIGFENQVVAVEARVSPPTDRVLPMVLYLEWGAEDAAGAWWDVPGRVVGAYLPQLPGVPGTSLTLEFASFAESCCFNPEWYRHWSFPGSWVVDDRPLGHRLGGHGREISIAAVAYPAGPGTRLSLDIFGRDRGVENLYSPERLGSSLGGAAKADWRPGGGRLELGAAGELENAGEWVEFLLEMGLRYIF